MKNQRSASGEELFDYYLDKLIDRDEIETYSVIVNFEFWYRKRELDRNFFLGRRLRALKKEINAVPVNTEEFHNLIKLYNRLRLGYRPIKDINYGKIKKVYFYG